MLKKKLFMFAISLFSNLYAEDINTDWLIVGAGPAGIITIGVLMDLGIQPESIMWVDPEFNVGRIGKYYSMVPGNTKTKKFVEFIQQCKIFKECSTNAIQTLCNYDQDKEYPLSLIIKPLEDITEYLCKKVRSQKKWLSALDRDTKNNTWIAETESRTKNKNKIIAKHVVLATGSHPKSLNYSGLTELSLDIAINPENLEKMVSPEDKVLVIGSSHSAILILKFLVELKNPVTKIISLYNKPLVYPIDMGTWTQNLHSGLKGVTAEWAHEFLEKNLPANLQRLYNNSENIEAAIKECNKVVYACGFERNELPNINNNPSLEYDENGMLAPGLFGIGIAFPEHYIDPLNNKEHPVGLNSFLDYAQRVAPKWLRSKRDNTLNNLIKFSDLFEIYIV